MAADRRRVVEALQDELTRTSPTARPHEHAALAYRLGLAEAEAAPGDASALRRALASYERAAAGFDPRFDPVEHARVLNAAGAAHRTLGAAERAASLFGEAARLLAGRGRDDERAAAFSNLGLVRTDQGRAAEAAAAFDVAVALFDDATAGGRRGRAAAVLNRGLARAATGTAEGLDAALADYEDALAGLDADEAPYQRALGLHAVGVACTSLADARPEAREALLDRAVAAFSESLHTFTRDDLPFQHALALHNLGRAWAAQAGLTSLRRALGYIEDALAVLDPRLHADAWRHAHASLTGVEAKLAGLGAAANRTTHFATLAAEASDDERHRLLTARLVRLLALPEPARASALVDLALAGARLGPSATRALVEAELTVAMELPSEALEAVLAARVAAHERLDDTLRDGADRALDQAIGDALGGPQRVWVRDRLYSLGFERP